MLKQAITQSGMFYEAHQAEWVEGRLAKATLLQEPQGKLSSPAAFATLDDGAGIANLKASAEPAAAPADNGIWASSDPGIAKTPDGRTLTVAGKNETLLPIAPLTTALSSRDWLAGGTFTGATTGSTAGGTLEVGYQIGCGIELNNMKLAGSISGTFGNSTLGIAGFNAPGTISLPIIGGVEVYPKPGTVTNVVVDKKTFKATSARVTLKDIHIKVDGCVGASSIRSYAVLTSSSTDDDDIVAYYGVSKQF